MASAAPDPSPRRRPKVVSIGSIPNAAKSLPCAASALAWAAITWSSPPGAALARIAAAAVAMNKVALIGVFGADNANRYAYVRMGNGALKKVKVGDTLDGGTVVAISASELRYQKGGKMVVLQMPREG